MAKDTATRGLRDEATVGPDPTRARDLKRLSELRFEVADGEPDVRGWHVYASTGREIGTVTDLLVDVEAGEVVMLDVDLRRNDQHTFVPIRAAWIDHGTRRVVLDARALEAAAGAALGTGTAVAPPDPAPVPASVPASVAEPVPVALPALSRGGALTDADIQRFDEDYVRAYGDRGTDRDAVWRVPRGSDEALRFEPRRLLDPAAPVSAPASVPAAPAPLAADATDRRTSRVDDASALDDAAAIDPRELDARVRIDEGASVDEGAPVAGVRYDAEPHPQHDYGTPDEAYGPGHGSGRIGFNRVTDRVVSREPYVPPDAADDARADAANAVRYRRYEDGYTGPPR